MLDDISVDQLIADIGARITTRLAAHTIARPALIGIRTGGVWIAQRLHQILGLEEPLGELNIGFYRDDFSRVGMHPTVEPSQLPFEVDERDLILIDDILFTGRTVPRGDERDLRLRAAPIDHARGVGRSQRS